MKENLNEVKLLSLTGITNWLNENFKKQNGEKFKTVDVQSYIRRGYLPKYLGDYSIKREKKIEQAKLYNIVNNENTGK